MHGISKMFKISATPAQITKHTKYLLFSCRLVELLPSVHIPQYWGITTKCLCYAKASSDPFVYCLLRHQYRKVLIRIIGCVLRKDHYLLSASSWSSTFDTTEDNCARTTWIQCAAPSNEAATCTPSAQCLSGSSSRADGREPVRCSRTLSLRAWSCASWRRSVTILFIYLLVSRTWNNVCRMQARTIVMCANHPLKLYRLLISTGLISLPAEALPRTSSYKQMYTLYSMHLHHKCYCTAHFQLCWICKEMLFYCVKSYYTESNNNEIDMKYCVQCHAFEIVWLYRMTTQIPV